MPGPIDPIVLFFLLGLGAGVLKADLRLPPAIYEFVSTLLLLSIGMKGGVELSRHTARSFDDLEQHGETLSGFDLIVAMSPASQRKALDLTRLFHLSVEYWPIMDPTGLGEEREAKLNAYRQTRDQIYDQLKGKWGS